MAELIKVNKVSDDVELIVSSVFGRDLPSNKFNDIDFLMGLPFKIEVTQIPENEGGGFSSKLLGVGLSVIGDGETIEEAIKDMRSYQRDWLEFYINKNKDLGGNKHAIHRTPK